VEAKLSVAVGNAAARALYEAMGFEPVTYSMRKVVG
jgi:ribosomal protein S18 acetylase RimI-like enzyme